MSEKELLVQSAVTLLATGRAEKAAEALSMAAQMLAEVERAYASQKARRKKRTKKKTSGGRSTRSRKTKTGSKAKRSKAKAGKPIPIRALRVLQRIGVVGADEAPNAKTLKRQVCEAHLFSAKNCGQATVQQVADWFEAHGETLVKECETFSEDWMNTTRCDETAG